MSTTNDQATTKSYDGFTAEERDAMKQRAKELKTASRRTSRNAKADGEADVLAKIAEMSDADRATAERVHALVKANAPTLTPRLWYGMPAYAADGKIVCHFQPAAKFKTRYSTFAFSDPAQLDEGTMWASAFAITELTAADEAVLGALVRKAVG